MNYSWHNTVTCMSVTIDGIWIGNCSATANSHSAIRYSTHLIFSVCCVFTSRCLVAASNGGRSPSSGFLNSPRTSAISFYQQQLRRTEPQQGSNSFTHSPNNSAHPTDWLQSESELLHDWRFAANQFVLAPRSSDCFFVATEPFRS
jgi:hypothetical protein